MTTSAKDFIIINTFGTVLWLLNQFVVFCKKGLPGGASTGLKYGDKILGLTPPIKSYPINAMLGNWELNYVP